MLGDRGTVVWGRTPAPLTGPVYDLPMGSLRHLPRSLLTFVAGFLATLLGSLAVIVLSRFSPTSARIDQVARLWSRAWLAAAGTKLTVLGSENIDPDRSYVVVANHISNLDVMACFLAVPLPIRFLAKKELFSIPLLATAMRSIGIVEVDRASHSPVHDQINAQARDLVAAGRSLIIYPEGTRSRRRDVAPFKKGAFTMAVATGLPVLPVTIHGSYEAWPPESPWVKGGHITVRVDPAVATTAMTQANVGELRDDVHRLITRRFKELDEGPGIIQS